MRPLLFTVVAASAFAASVALAQPAPPPRPDDAPPPPREERMDRGMQREGMFRRFMRREPPKAAFFNFRRGDSSVTIKCADDEPTKACTDAAAALLDALKK